MTTRRFLLFQFGLLALLFSGCLRAPPPSGELLYRRFCASCYGMSGKGGGPVAGSLRRAPGDLTTLARRAGGRFEEREVMAIIDGQRLVAEHGPREMPVWGAIFDEELADQPHSAYRVLLRARVLSDYLRSIQEK